MGTYELSDIVAVIICNIISFSSPPQFHNTSSAGIWFMEERGFDKFINFPLLTMLISSRIKM